MKITISEIIREDAATVWEIEKRSFSHPCTFNDILSAVSTDNITKIYKAADENGVICGFVSVMSAGDEVEIIDIAVDEPYRKRGIGEALLRFVIDDAKSKNCLAIYLEVRESNEPARSLYKKFGFEITGVRQNYYRYPTENAVNMKKTLFD